MCVVIDLAQNCSHTSLRDCFNWDLGIPEWLLWKALVTQASGKISKKLNFKMSSSPYEKVLCVWVTGHISPVFLSSPLFLPSSASHRTAAHVSMEWFPGSAGHGPIHALGQRHPFSPKVEQRKLHLGGCWAPHSCMWSEELKKNKPEVSCWSRKIDGARQMIDGCLLAGQMYG